MVIVFVAWVRLKRWNSAAADVAWIGSSSFNDIRYCYVRDNFGSCCPIYDDGAIDFM